MALTIEEIRNGIAENPELKTNLLNEFDSELPDYLKGKGFKVYTAEDEEKEFGRRLGPKVSELYNGVEKDFLESLGKYGVTKSSNTEKIYDMIKKAPGLIDAKIADLESKLAEALAGKGDDVTKAQIEAYKKQVDDLTTEKEQLTQGFAQKELGFKVNGEFEKAYSELQIVVPASVADKDKADYIKGKRELLYQALNSKYQAKEENGNIVYTDSEGNVQMNGTSTATAKDLLLKDFKYDFEAVNKGGSGSKGGKSDAPIVVQSKEQLYTQLAKEGLTMGSSKYLERANELAKTNGIDLAK